MKLTQPVVTLAIGSAFALAACGNDDKSSSEAAAQQATPAEAVTEIGATKAGLEKALTQLRAGNRKAAEETVSNTYLDHFEHVEGPLGKVDDHLNEEIEEGISMELRDKIAKGAPTAEVAKFVKQLEADLDEAKAKLQ
jgi:hypothetical protein